MKNNNWTVLKVVLTVVLVGSAAGLAVIRAGLSREKKQFAEIRYEALRDSVPEDAPETEPETEAEPENEPEPETETAKMFLPSADGRRGSEAAETEAPVSFPLPNAVRFAGFMEENSDFAGWIRIEETTVDYPVMCSPENPDFYLHHDFLGKNSKSGVPYLGKNCNTGCDHMIIFAHNMKNGTMFADLLRYADRDFYREHPLIRFDTPEGNGVYEILAVFRERVHYSDEKEAFRYYDYGGDLSEEDFLAYVSRVREISLYDTGKNAVYGQQLLTLSTCSYHTENGRFAVVAVKKELPRF